MISAGGWPAYHMVFGSNPACLFGWEDAGGDMLFMQDTSLSGQFAQQWELRIRAQEMVIEEVANRKLRRPLAYNKSPNRADIAIGDSVLFYKAQSLKSLPRWRGPARILDIHETGATVTFQSQTLKVARYCVRKRQEEKDAQEEEWQTSMHRGDPCMSQTPARPDGAQVSKEVTTRPLDLVDRQRETGSGGVPTDLMREPSLTFPRSIPVPGSPPPSAQPPTDFSMNDKERRRHPSIASALPLKLPQQISQIMISYPMANCMDCASCEDIRRRIPRRRSGLVWHP